MTIRKGEEYQLQRTCASSSSLATNAVGTGHTRPFSQKRTNKDVYILVGEMSLKQLESQAQELAHPDVSVANTFSQRMIGSSPREGLRWFSFNFRAPRKG